MRRSFSRSSGAQRLREAFTTLRDVTVSVGPLLALVVALLWAAYVWLQPTPPTRLVLATGPEQGAYAEFGARYAKLLAADGIELLLLPSDGSSHNLDLVRSGQADMGFVQGGSADLTPQDKDSLVSLGSLFVEPLWVFYREAEARARWETLSLTHLRQMQGWRVNVGTEGSGVPRLLAAILEANGMQPRDFKLSQERQTPAVVQLLAGELDALVFVSAPEAPMVQMLLQTPGIRLLNFPQSEAYGRRMAFLTPLALPQGIVDLAANKPPQRQQLIATTTSLVAATQTHPALQQLAAQAALRLHGAPGWFSRAGEYPSLAHAELPLSAEAVRALTSGVPWLQRYLPFWLANLIERMGLALGLIVALALPLSRIVPPLYTFRVRSRVFRWYAELRDIEQLSEGNGQLIADNRDELLGALNALEQKVELVHVPLAYADELYSLRGHIHLVRKKLMARSDAQSGSGP